MAIIAKAETSTTNFEPIPEGAHLAYCYAIIDLGIQYSKTFDIKSRKIQVFWELPDETYTTKENEVKPRNISKEYTLSLGDKANLRKDLQAWRGKAFTEDELQAFDVGAILGKGCQLQIIHEKKGDKTYTKIASIMGLPKGLKLPASETPLTYFDLSSGEPLEEIEEQILKLPEWIQNKIKESETYLALKYNNSEDDEIPFN